MDRYFDKVRQWKEDYALHFKGRRLLNVGYAHHIVEVELETASVSLEPPKDVVISYADNWNGCFGGVIEHREGNKIRVKVYTD